MLWQTLDDAVKFAPFVDMAKLVTVVYGLNHFKVCAFVQGRGRDRGYPLPPAQIPASGISDFAAGGLECDHSL